MAILSAALTGSLQVTVRIAICIKAQKPKLPMRLTFVLTDDQMRTDDADEVALDCSP